MRYYTLYTLDVYEGDKDISEILQELEENYEIELEGLYYAVQTNGEPIDSVKWYDHDDDMEILSKKYPDHIFVLYGEGEESRDMWRKYYKNGMVQHCNAEITFESFNESKLRKI